MGTENERKKELSGDIDFNFIQRYNRITIDTDGKNGIGSSASRKLRGDKYEKNR